MMKPYQCHKQVLAAKIVNIATMRHDDGPATVRTTLHLEGGSFVQVSPEWVAKHVPSCGGYFVQYDDGYESFSPAKAFESGYTDVSGIGFLDRIARVCHEVNRAYCAALGDQSQPAWEDAPEWQRVSARIGVDLHLSGDFGPAASHISWLNQKLEEGWKYGPVKDPEKKEHPCIVPFSELSREQQAKDFLFRAVVHALK